MLVELGLVEQRYKAVCEVLESATVVDGARRNGVVRRRCTTGFAATRGTAGAGWWTARPSPSPAPTRWPPRSRSASSSCVGLHPGWGADARLLPLDVRSASWVDQQWLPDWIA